MAIAFPQSRKHQLLALILLALVAYSNSFKAPFEFDDSGYITNNSFIQDAGKLFSGYSDDDEFENSNVIISKVTRWVVFMTFWGNFVLNGLDPIGYHVVNFLIHGINGIIVYYMVIYLFATPWIQRSEHKPRPDIFAFLTAMLFLLHPIQTESVTYISQRFTSLSALFYMLTAMLYLRLRNEVEITGDKANKLLYATAFASAVLAMFSKENSFTLPFIILLIEGIFYSGKSILPVKRRVALSGGFLALLPIIPITKTLFAEYLSGGVMTEATRTADIPRMTYLLTQFRVIVKYIGLLIWPQEQSLIHMMTGSTSFFEPAVLVSFALLIAIFLLGIYALIASRRSGGAILKIASFGVFWFFIALSVESSLIPLSDFIFEHRVYLPSFGFFIAILSALYYFVGKTDKQSLKLTITVLIVGMAFAGATFARNDVWRSPVSLWGDTQKKSPSSMRANINLAGAYASAGKHAMAVRILRDAEENLPHYRVEINIELGKMYLNQGMNMIALERFEAALKINPDNVNARKQLGFYYLNQGDYDRSIAEFETALKLVPDYVNRKKARFFIDKIKKMKEMRRQ